MTTVLQIGTMKGAWLARSDDRTAWDISQPALKGWQVTTFGRTADGTHLAATASTWYGAAVHRSEDLADWQQVVPGPQFEGDGAPSLEKVWTLATTDGALFAGVAEAGLFRSDDNAATWRPVPGFNEHPTRPGWQPGLGGLAAHRILVDPADVKRMWVGVSAVGVFYTEDGGTTWELRNAGIPHAAQDDTYPDIGFCVHGLVADPAAPDTIWRQDHLGVFRTTNGALSWHRIEDGLPAGFGFAIGRDTASGRLFVVPLESDEFRMPVGGEFAVYSSDDGGDSWQMAGGWSRPGSDTVLRDAIATDGEGGVYVGTTGGRVAVSSDAGESWHELPHTFPRILSVHALTV